MRARPRTCPSIRFSRLRVATLLSFAMRSIYPIGVFKARQLAVASTHHHHQSSGGVIDPVCSMSVDPHTAKHRADYRGHTYYFCSAGCRTKFIANPQKYLDDRVLQSVAEGAIYTCPMHPEIRQVGPGSCPICGMALEPEIAGTETGPNPELVDMSRRFWIGLVLTLPVFTLEMGAHLVGAHAWVDPTLSNYVQ